MIDGWNGYLDALYREQSRLYNDIQAARQLGLSDAQIRRNLIQKAKLGKSEVSMIMRGQFAPSGASKEVLQEVRLQVSQEERRRLSTTVPVSDLNRLSAERRGQPLSPDAAAQVEPVMFGEPVATPTGTQVSPAAPTSTPLFGEPVTAPDSGPAAAPAAPTQAPPQDLLGGNLMDRMRNLEIFNRTQGQ